MCNIFYIKLVQYNECLVSIVNTDGTRASVATVLTMHPCISKCLRVNHWCAELFWNIYAYFHYIIPSYWDGTGIGNPLSWNTRGWFNIKMLSYQYRKSHCGDKTIYDRLISTMGFPILVRWHLYIESWPRTFVLPSYQSCDQCCLEPVMTKFRFEKKNFHYFRVAFILAAWNIFIICIIIIK